MLDDFKVQNDCFLLYFADLQNSTVNPNIENYLNQYYVKNLSDLDQIIKNDKFVFNTRVVKYILNNTSKDCLNFLGMQSLEFIRELFFLAIGNSYGQFEEYKENLRSVLNIIGNYEDDCTKKDNLEEISSAFYR